MPRLSGILIAVSVVAVIGLAGFITFATLYGVEKNAHSSSASAASLAAAAAYAVSANTCLHGGQDAPASSLAKCKTARASLELDTSGCPSTFNGTTNMQCTRQARWGVSKTSNSPAVQVVNNASVGADVCSTDGPYAALNTFNVTITKTVDATRVVTGTAQLVLTNGGACEASISSLLLLLEQSGNVGDNSYGPGGAQHKLWATSGSENPTTAGLCATPTLAGICEKNGNANCNVNVTYVPGLIQDTDTSALLDLSAHNVAASATCTTKQVLNLQFGFALDAATQAAMAAGKATGYRITALVTFDACCERGAACATNIDCSADGSKEAVRTVQVRSPSFNLALTNTCTERCSSIRYQVRTASSDNSPFPDHCSMFTLETGPSSTVTTISASTTAIFPYKGCCQTSSCDCVAPVDDPTAIMDASITDIVTLAFVPGHTTECRDMVTGASVLSPGVAIASREFQCLYPNPVDCVYSDWSEWSTIVPCPDDSCATTEQRTRTIVTTDCHGGVACDDSLLVENQTGICSRPCEPKDDAVRTIFYTNYPHACAQQNCSAYAPEDIIPACRSADNDDCVDTCDDPAPYCPGYTEWSDWGAWTPCLPQGMAEGCTMSGTQSRSLLSGECDFACLDPLTNTTTESCDCPDNGIDMESDHGCTYTQGGYHNCASNSNPPQCDLFDPDSLLLPVYVGTTPTDNLTSACSRFKFTTWAAVQAALPAGGTPAAIPNAGNGAGTYLNPTTTFNNTLYGQLLTAYLNANLNASNPTLYFHKAECELHGVADSSGLYDFFDGMTLQQVVFFSEYLAASRSCIASCDFILVPPPGAVDPISTTDLTLDSTRIVTVGDCTSLLATYTDYASLSEFLAAYNNAFDACAQPASVMSCYRLTPPDA